MATNKPTGPTSGPAAPPPEVAPPLSGNAGQPSLSRDASDPWRGGSGGSPTDKDVSKGSMGKVTKEDAKGSKKTGGIKDNPGTGKESVVSRTALKHKTPAQKMYPKLPSRDGD
ncbi:MULTISPECIES: hypothetical protein [Ralstonia]|uniref:Uncharacterized protein n=1 Tax=Ralstonia condita TaxID=3058600 RepID=A0ABM9J0Y3_9RALS|nr:MULTISPECIES: hypothetical protein [Ralstonia]MBB0023640.1 hypothetical protein [Ralstonia pickettii]MBB0097001.1 hypothetical protein [Ralstonia pickettii]MBB0107029.1 hypothetical protein [Ralstonia pickettii]MBB0127774.1 hypothetical protein [Ralstonia pickettii]MBB0160729.1 hypothetical protein [Ralstonia pickettii]